MSVKLGLGMIVKDEVKDLEYILSSWRNLFDEVHITITNPSKRQELEELCVKHNATPSYFEWVNDFSAARNFNKCQFKEADYYMRIDADDTILNQEAVRRVVEKAKDENVSLVLCNYNYSRDEDGNTNASHYRETFIRCSENLFWNKKIHENILPISKAGYKVVLDDEVQIFHRITPEKAYESSVRNFQYLMDEYNKDKENPDPRTIAYLGRVLHGLSKFKEARFFLEKHIATSGWDEDRYMSWVMLADIFLKEQNYEQSIAACFEAMSERPDYPDAYLKMHDIYHERQMWREAIEWGSIGLIKKAPKGVMLVDPSYYTWRPILSMSFCYLQTGDYVKANKLFDQAKKYVPNLEWILKYESLYKEALAEKNYLDNFFWMHSYLKKNDPKKLPSFVNSIPEKHKEHEVLVYMKNKYSAPKKWADNTVVIYCGKVFEEWGPWSIDGGIGGSEEAVIHLSKELANLGFDVYVYNECGDREGVYDGVHYVNFYKFNPKDEYATLISWRTNIFVMTGVKAKNRWIWMHDIALHDTFVTREEIISFDKVIVLSEYHKSLISDRVPADKIFVSSNGILESIREGLTIVPAVERPNKVIYSSSYDRGLEHLLEMWPSVMNEVPDAELHIYYGLNNLEKVAKTDPDKNAFVSRIKTLLNQPGVFEHGRVGQPDLHKAMSESKIWAYPSHFPEISCITAMKAQALGCYPVVTDYAALKETVKGGTMISGVAGSEEVNKRFFMALVAALRNTPQTPQYMMPTWKGVADSWARLMQENITTKVFIQDRFEWVRSKCKPSETIVDIGGNDGHTFDGWNRDNVTTVDIDLYEIQNFVRADAHNLPFEDKKFDVSVLCEILEHVDDPIKCIKEARRVSNRLIITVPEEHDWPQEYDPMMSIEAKEVKEGKERLVLAREGNPKCKDFYMEDNLAHLWHNRHYTKEMLEEHIKLAGYTNFTVQKLVLGAWVFYGAVCEG